MGKRVFVAASALAAVAGFVWITATRSREPRYGGHHLSHWVLIYGESIGAGWPISPETTNALSHIGTNAIPYLVRWITYSPTSAPFSDRAVAFLIQANVPRVAKPVTRALASLLQGEDAGVVNYPEQTFSYLGTPALPPLFQLLEEQPSVTNEIGARVSRALSCYHTDEAIPFYIARILDTNCHYRPFFVHLLGRCPLVTNAAPAFNTLIECLTNTDAAVAGSAKGAFCTPPWLSQPKFVAFLSNRLETSEDLNLRSNIVVVLGDMGLHWTYTNVVAALTDPDACVRVAATNAIQKWIRLVHSSYREGLSRLLSPP